jgi:hypothetical protein
LILKIGKNEEGKNEGTQQNLLSKRDRAEMVSKMGE